MSPAGEAKPPSDEMLNQQPGEAVVEEMCPGEIAATGEVTYGAASDEPAAGPAPTAPQDSRGAPTDASVVDLLLVACFTLFNIVGGVVLWRHDALGGDGSKMVFGLPADLAMLAILIAATTAVIRDRPALATLVRSRPGLLVAGSVGWVLIALAAHPSWRGLDWTLRSAAVAAFVVLAVRGGRDRALTVVTGVVAVATAQAMFGIAQTVHGGLLGIGPFEWADKLYRVGGITAARGSLPHPYYLAGLLLVGIAGVVVLHALTEPTRRTTVALHAVMVTLAVVLSFTFSRAALLALLPMIALTVSMPRARRLAGSLVLGVAVGTLLTLSGQASKLDKSLDRDRVDSGRVELFAEAMELTRENALVGVGPGRYSLALQEDGAARAMPSHNVVAHFSAETGVAGGAVATTLLVSFAWWAWRRGPLTMLAAVSLTPFLLLDWYPYASAVGLTMTAFWLAVVAIAARTKTWPPAELAR